MENESLVRDPPFTRYLFRSTNSSWIWLIARVYLGWQWVHAGYLKLTDPAWMNGGTALKGFWTKAVALPVAPAKPQITYGWYRGFLITLLDGGHYTWFAKVIAIGETLIGVALILGFLTGLAAFFGAFMNFNFMLAGSASTNPVLFTLAILLIMAWKVAGYWGLDRFVLHRLTPWHPGSLVSRDRSRNATRFRTEERPESDNRLKPKS